MVGIVLVSHSQAMALAVKELVVSMAGPKLAIAIAAGAGENHAELGTNAVEIVEAITNVMGEEGVLVLMDLGSAMLSTDTALEFLDETQRARVRLSPAPFVEGALAAGVSAALGSGIDEVQREAGNALRQKVEHLGNGESATSPAPASAPEKAAEPGQTIRLTVPNPHGFHARPAARFVREAAAFQSRIQVRNVTRGRGPASARSVTGLASLEILQGDEIEVSASGPDAEAALRALGDSVRSGLGDSLEVPAPVESSTVASSAFASASPVPVSPGVATGPLFFGQNVEPVVPQNRVADAADEIRRLHEALRAAKVGIAGERAALRGSAGKDEAEIFEAQALVLEDPALLECAEKSIREEHENAALAWAHAFQDVAADYARLQDEYLRQRAADVRDIGARVLAALGVARPRVGDLAEPGILVVDDLAPAEVTALPDTVLGVILLHGGRTSHAAILLRARGVPALAGAQHAFEKAGLAPGSNGNHIAAFDGATGELWIDPDPAELYTLRARSENQHAAVAQAARLRHEPASTADGHRIAIFANLANGAEAAGAIERGAEGVGLFRTEFLFLDRATAPGEEEQFGALSRLRARPAIPQPAPVEWPRRPQESAPRNGIIGLNNSSPDFRISNFEFRLAESRGALRPRSCRF
jgi:phosphocarrier protein FPr